MARESKLLKKVVLRMRDGSLRKCSIYSNLAASFHSVKVLTTEGGVETVQVSDLKAVFFVREFQRTPGRHAQRLGLLAASRCIAAGPPREALPDPCEWR